MATALEEKRAAFEKSVDTKLLYQMFEAAKVGECVTFAAMSEKLGVDVREHRRGNITSAVRSIMREKAWRFDNVRGVGYKRLSDIDVANSGEKEISHLRNAARRSVKRLTCVSDVASLPNDARIKHHASLSMIGAVSAVTSVASVRRIEKAVEKDANGLLPLAKTLACFSEK